MINKQRKHEISQGIALILLGSALFIASLIYWPFRKFDSILRKRGLK